MIFDGGREITGSLFPSCWTRLLNFPSQCFSLDVCCVLLSSEFPPALFSLSNFLSAEFAVLLKRRLSVMRTTLSLFSIYQLSNKVD